MNLEKLCIDFHFIDDQGDSYYYQKKEPNLEMEEWRGDTAGNDIQQQEN